MASTKINFSWSFDSDKTQNLVVGKDVAYYRLKKLMPEFVWDITWLEDNPYTFLEVQTLIEGITVGGYSLSDQKQVLNQFESLKYLMKLIKQDNFKFDQANILTAHNIIAEGEALKWGCLRDGEVRIGGTEHKPPLAAELNELQLNGIDEISHIANPFERALVYFCFGSINQFFYDGNKRTSRWVMNAILMSHGYNYISIPADKKQVFDQAMVDFYNTKDANGIMRFLMDCYIAE